jgi:hypothetical protein
MANCKHCGRTYVITAIIIPPRVLGYCGACNDHAPDALRAVFDIVALIPRGRDGVPPGWKELGGNGQVGIYIKGNQIIVVGVPYEYENLSDDDPRHHNCDVMGCGWEHVLWRGTLPGSDKINWENKGG